jgi:hypothetical protein
MEPRTVTIPASVWISLTRLEIGAPRRSSGLHESRAIDWTSFAAIDVSRRAVLVNTGWDRHWRTDREDNVGTGHKWRLIDDRPWRRAYIVLKAGAKDSFVPKRGVKPGGDPS